MVGTPPVPQEVRVMGTKKLGMRILAASLVLLFPVTTSPVLAGASTASLSGQLFSVVSSEPLVGAKLHLQDPATGRSYVSSPTEADGRVDVAQLPPSSYRIAVESNGGLYVVDAPVKLDAGEARSVRLSVREAGGRGRAGRAESGSTPSDPGNTSFWSNPLTATLVVVGAAILVGVIVDEATSDDDETPASPSNP
jgi:hypothetical protein